MNEKHNTPQPELEILVVDDDPIVRLLHQYQIQESNHSYPVFFFKNGREAVDHLRAKEGKHPTYLVLLDLSMPIMDGWEFLEECSKNYGQVTIHIVVVTSSINKIDEIKAVEYPQVIAFCNKPLNAKNWKELMASKEFSAFYPVA